MKNKKILSALLALCLLVGCGTNPDSSVPSSQEEVLNPLEAAALGLNDTEPVETEIIWEELNLIDDRYGYLLSETDFSTVQGDFSGHETTLFLESEQDNSHLPVIRQAIDGTELERVYLPQPEDELSDYTSVRMLADCLWAVRRDKTIVDAQTGEWTAQFTLEQWDKNEVLLRSIPIDDSFCEHPEDVFYVGLHQDPEGNLLVGLDEGLYRLDATGAVTGFLSYEGGNYSTCTSREGELYLENGSGVYPINWDSFTLGEALFPIRSSDLISPGSGPYDFFLRGSKSLKGVSLQEGTISTILNWSDWNLTTPDDVIYLDENTLLVSVYGVFSGRYRYITMEKLPLSELPEKQTIHLAIGVEQGLAESGIGWQNCTYLEDPISDFNLTSGTWEIEVSTFSTANELNLLMLGDNPPDAIYWGNTGLTTLELSYIRKGYLTDLTPYFDQDEDLSLDCFFPQLVAAATASDGAIYAMPTYHRFNVLIGRQDLVGTEQGWTLDEFISAAQALPEDVSVRYYSSLYALQHYLTPILGQFVDLEAGTCDFTGETFQTLLTFCKTEFWANAQDVPEADNSEDAAMAGDIMLAEAFVISAPNLAANYDTYRQAGITFVGYPNVGSNGAVMNPLGTFSITTGSACPDGVWAFFQKLLSYDYQSAFIGMGSHTVRIDCMEPYAQWYAASFGLEYDSEDLQAVFDLYENSVVPASIDTAILEIVLEEAQAFFDGSKTAMEVGELLDSRIMIYLSEQS